MKACDETIAELSREINTLIIKNAAIRSLSRAVLVRLWFKIRLNGQNNFLK